MEATGVLDHCKNVSVYRGKHMAKDWILGDAHLDTVGERREVFWGRDTEVPKATEWTGKWRKIKSLDSVITDPMMISKHSIVVGE